MYPTPYFNNYQIMSILFHLHHSSHSSFLHCFLPDLPDIHFLPQLWSQPFLQRALVPFSGKWYLKIKIWILEDKKYMNILFVKA